MLKGLLCKIRTSTGFFAAAIFCISISPLIPILIAKYWIPYDSATGFSIWYHFGLNETLNFLNLSIFSDNFATTAMPPYTFMVGPIRLLSSFLLPDSIDSHFLIQAIHGPLLFTFSYLLLRSFDLSKIASAIGALVIMDTGINISLIQHTGRYEALAYFSASLFFSRTMIKFAGDRKPLEQVALAGLFAASMLGTIRWYHEAVHYFLPMAAWISGHLYYHWRRFDRRTKNVVLCTWVLIGIVVAIGELPIVLVAFETSLSNKTLINSAADAAAVSAAPNFLSYLLALVSPSAFGAAEQAGLPLLRKGDQTISYLFIGSSVIIFASCGLIGLWLTRRTREFYVCGIGIILSFGFYYGYFSPIHELLVFIYPLFGMMRHNYYGFSVGIYFIAFLCGYALDHLVSFRGFLVPVAICCAVASAMISYVAVRAGYLPGELTNQTNYLLSVLGDLVVVVVVASVIILATLILYRKPAWQHIVIGMLALVVAADVVRPIYGQNFIWGQREGASYSKFESSFGAARPIIEYLRSTSGDRYSWRPRRILSFGIGWWSQTVALAGESYLTSASTQGNMWIEKRIGAFTDYAQASRLAEDVGADFFWVYNNPSLTDALSANPSFQAVATSPSLGTLFAYKSDQPVYVLYPPDRFVISWFASGANAPKLMASVVSRSYTFDLSFLKDSKKPTCLVELPVMWRSLFVAEINGVETDYQRGDTGRIAVLISPCTSGTLVLRYPTAIISTGFVLAFVLTMSAYLLALLSAAFMLARRIYLLR